MGSHVEGLRVVMRLADDAEVGGVPEASPVPYLDDVIDLGHARRGHVGVAAGDGAAASVAGYDPGPESPPSFSVISGVVHWGTSEGED
jgi:hypothetical protein